LHITYLSRINEKQESPQIEAQRKLFCELLYLRDFHIVESTHQHKKFECLKDHNKISAYYISVCDGEPSVSKVSTS